MKKIFIKIVAINLFFVSLLICGCIDENISILETQQQNSDMNYENNSTNKESLDAKSITRNGLTELIRVEGDIKPKYPILFEIGEKIVYSMNVLEMGSVFNLTQEYVIKEVSTMNGNKSYKVDYIYEFPTIETHIESSVVNGIESGEHMYESVVIIKENRIAYIDANNGDLVDIIVNKTSIMTPEVNYEQGIWMYAPWMLSLERGKKWQIHVDTVQNSKVVKTTTVSYEVLSNIEQINDRACFKVNINWGTKDSGKELTMIDAKIIMWIDVEKRIAVKMQTYKGNLLTSEMNLISKF